MLLAYRNSNNKLLSKLMLLDCKQHSNNSSNNNLNSNKTVCSLGLIWHHLNHLNQFHKPSHHLVLISWIWAHQLRNQRPQSHNLKPNNLFLTHSPLCHPLNPPNLRNNNQPPISTHSVLRQPNLNQLLNLNKPRHKPSLLNQKRTPFQDCLIWIRWSKMPQIKSNNSQHQALICSNRSQRTPWTISGAQLSTTNLNKTKASAPSNKQHPNNNSKISVSNSPNNLSSNNNSANNRYSRCSNS